ncbi:unnamed protein product [Clavelina lepadiformis]|uniref:DNA repair protein SWI5 homolog n=1 Tax=Clavelina lepadiformis TaxID=159417 RepID=A0ABP0GW34_CLALP
MSTEKLPLTPLVRNRRLSSLSSSKVRAAFKSPCRSPTPTTSQPAGSATPTEKVITSPLAGPRSFARKRRSALENSFISPLKGKVPKTEAVVAEANENIEEFKQIIKDQEKEIAELHAEGLKETDLQLYIEKLHEYNEVKDVAQMVIGRLAVQLQTTTRSLYKQFDLELND